MARAVKAKRGRKPAGKPARTSVARKQSPAKSAAKRAGAASTGIHKIIAREADALAAERTKLAARLDQIDSRLSGLQIARDALDGKGYSPPVGRKASATRASSPAKPSKTGKSLRRGGWSEKVLGAITSGKANTRADLLTLFKAGDDKPTQMGISNAITLLKKSGRIESPGRGEYRAA